MYLYTETQNITEKSESQDKTREECMNPDSSENI